MRRRSAIAALLLMLACAAVTAAERPDDEAQLRAQAAAWDRDIVRKDRAGIERNLHARFFQIDGQGGRHARAEFIEMLLDPKLQIDPYDVPDLDVRRYGDMAQLTATTHMTGRYDGKPFTSAYRYIDTYVRERGRWSVVSVQITRLAAP
ncbi:nuclear transport factor 2 family protein [Tahibacter caeni]|uniref:nuclear transport factor 2 family protein n=1 Tax=Tahibacter caeni TaxID=1453545 RepID=UPI0021479094|nr:nuclear transport factor 2 family protein [Tahibacter caeni]